MRPLLRIILLIPAGFIAACLAAGLFFVLAAIGVGPEGAYLTTYRTETLILVLGVSAWAGALAFLPAMVFIAFAEAFGWRSPLFYLVAGAALGLFAEAAMREGETRLGADLPLFLATGTLGGFAYWLMAGRSARALLPRPRLQSGRTAP